MSTKDQTKKTSEQQGSFLAHSVAQLSYKFYYEQDKRGLELLARDLQAVLSHVNNCIESLNFLNNKGEIYAKLYLLLEYIGHEQMTEEFVKNLEALAERARACYENDEELEPSIEERFEIVRGLMQTIDKHEKEYKSSELKALSGVEVRTN